MKLRRTGPKTVSQGRGSKSETIDNIKPGCNGRKRAIIVNGSEKPRDIRKDIEQNSYFNIHRSGVWDIVDNHKFIDEARGILKG